jgi:hypothetical protein
MNWLTRLNMFASTASALGRFDVIGSGATPLSDPVKSQEIVSAFRDAGATWWLEWLDEQSGTFAQMREHVRKGPPKVC